MKYYTNNSFSHMQALVPQISIQYPAKLYIDITQDCNLYCVMCRDKLRIEDRTMDLNLFKRIIDETCSYVMSYSLFNWGEPLLVRDFKERVLYLKSKKQKNATIDISTNGMLLNDDMISFLLANEVITTVSIDSANEEIFEKIRRGGKFDRIIKNTQNLAAKFGETKNNRVPGIYTSIQKDNQNDLLDLAKLCKDIGIRRMGFGLVVSPKEFSPDTNDDLRDMITKTKMFLDKENILNDLYPTKIGEYVWDGDGYYHQSNYLVDKYCNAPYVSASISYNGDVFLCCNVGEKVENMKNKSLNEIWTGKRYEKLRKAVNDVNSMPQICRNCPWFNRNKI